MQTYRVSLYSSFAVKTSPSHTLYIEAVNKSAAREMATLEAERLGWRFRSMTVRTIRPLDESNLPFEDAKSDHHR